MGKEWQTSESHLAAMDSMLNVAGQRQKAVHSMPRDAFTVRLITPNYKLLFVAVAAPISLVRIREPAGNRRPHPAPFCWC
ncbi:hypothetical protein [Ruegeria sp.]|uniref:hypothetical protein n=1 Tax=Ruegeria sp. TaxID=1879320 RepID=UPI003B59387A